MKNLLLIACTLCLFSCKIQTDYFFEENDEVKMKLKVDMSAVFAMIPATEDEGGFGNVKDSLENAGLKDSLLQQGMKDVSIDFDTNTFVLNMAAAFVDFKSYEDYMNKDRDPNAKPIKTTFNATKFKLENCSSLVPEEVIGNLKSDEEGAEQMGAMMTFNTVYHFPYKVKELKSKAGNGTIGEDKKSVSFTNTLDDFINDAYDGDFEVSFK